MMTSFNIRPTLITHAGRNYLIGDAPTNTNSHHYVDIFMKHNIKMVVRLCGSTYDEKVLRDCGIQIIDLIFDDGGPPPSNIIDKWLEIVENIGNQTLYIHCVAGLGRAPTLVAIALIEHGMEPFEAIQYIRHRRKGVFNSKQLTFIENYRKKKNHRKCVIL